MLQLVGLQWLILGYQDIDTLLPGGQLKFSYRFLAIWHLCSEERKYIWNVISDPRICFNQIYKPLQCSTHKPLTQTFLSGIDVFSDHTAFIFLFRWSQL